MKQFIQKIIFKTKKNEILNITDAIDNTIKKSNINNGLLNLSILHTSCSLMIQENADPKVMKDIKNFLKKIAPEDDYLHDTEGPDDMPAHLKSLLTQTNLTMTIKNQKILLGTWQGIFLLEHRYQPKNRELFFHLLGE
ncbi:MAG: hypothetical protein CMP38_05885 [Rickettsiales bacterium]|nr:hypothetical protein [Rickettsiales bacterium]|tara:strand:+ start:540 stop:953 length:414 start_codon:yes stop_codon:yes gene_type:complete